jgi:hypothetical protein
MLKQLHLEQFGESHLVQKAKQIFRKEMNKDLARKIFMIKLTV